MKIKALCYEWINENQNIMFCMRFFNLTWPSGSDVHVCTCKGNFIQRLCMALINNIDWYRYQYIPGVSIEAGYRHSSGGYLPFLRQLFLSVHDHTDLKKSLCIQLLWAYCTATLKINEIPVYNTCDISFLAFQRSLKWRLITNTSLGNVMVRLFKLEEGIEIKMLQVNRAVKISQ